MVYIKKGYRPWIKGKCMDKEKYPNFGNRNKPYSEASKIRISNTLKGKLKSEATKRKMSDSHIGLQTGKSNPFYGKHHTETTKNKIRQHHSKATEFKAGHKNSERWKIWRLHATFPRKDTSIELKLQNGLSNRGIAYQKHYPILGQPDICFPEQKIAIFADGTYWHNLDKVKERDLKVNETLRNQGWLVLRYTETEINSNIKEVLDEIEEVER